jgi:hypothetical protein
MSTKTNFHLYLVAQDTCQIKVKHVKFKEHEFSLTQGVNEISFESFTSWSLPCRFIVTSLSDKLINLCDLKYSIPTYDNLKFPIVVESENDSSPVPFRQTSILPNSEVSIRFYCKIVNINKTRS